MTNKTARRIVGILALVIAGLSLGCGSPGSDSKPLKTATATASPEADEPQAHVPVPAEFKLTVTTLDKQCFGSAGCSLTFRVTPAYSGPDLSDAHTYRVIYQVTGDESGVQTGSFTVTGNNVSYDTENSAQTKNTNVALTAKVTQVIEE